MTRALLVDTNFSAGPIRKALEREGYEVWVVGCKSDDALAVSVENYTELDYSNVAHLKSLARELDVQALIPGCNDLSYTVCCQLASVLEFSGFETEASLERLHNKDRFRSLCRTLSIPAPNTYATISDAMQAPGDVIIKPVDAYSGRGIQVLKQPTQQALQAALSQAATKSRTGKALIEDFIEGELWSYSAFLTGGAVSVAFNVAEFGSVNPFVVDTSFVTPQTDLAPRLKKDVELLAAKLGITSGLLHLQYITDGVDYWLIEPTRRCPGDLYSELIRLSTGYPYATAYIAPFINSKLPPKSGHHDHSIVRHTIAADRPGIFESLVFSDSALLEAWYPLARTGDTLGRSPDGRIGVAFFRTASTSQRRHLVEELMTAEKYRVQFRDSKDAY